MNQDLQVSVHGAAGRMGRAVIAAISASEGLRVVSAIEPSASAHLGRDAGELAGVGALGVAITDDVDAALADAQIVIDFSRPEGTMALVDALRDRERVLVTGTTGLSAAEQDRLHDLAGRVAVVQAANFSVGVNLCIRLSELAARVLDDDADVEIIEAHHRHKVDAPSGTALRLGQAVAEATGRSLEHDAVRARDGNIGPRPERAIGFATVRGGDIIGDHTVLFACEGERVEITHKASSRQNFAGGALRAARWAVAQPPGLYDMPDVLGLA